MKPHVLQFFIISAILLITVIICATLEITKGDLGLKVIIPPILIIQLISGGIMLANHPIFKK
jgi:hypothetical protein